MSASTTPNAERLVNVDRLQQELRQAGLDVLVAAAPENTFYLAGVFIRTQVSIRDRLACVVWPLDGAPTFIVCDIEESLARTFGSIADVRIYVEFARSPVEVLAEVLRERGLDRARVGVERRFLSADAYDELRERLPAATLLPADRLLEQVKAIKTLGEIDRAVSTFRATEEAIAAAWGASRAGDTEKQIAERMVRGVQARGADGVRHMTLCSGENIVHAHNAPSDRVLRPGDLLLTDFGANWGGYCSDIARMGVIGEPSAELRREYQTFRAVQRDTIAACRPGATAAQIYEVCRAGYERVGMRFRSPHVGHSLGRGGGHDQPMLHPRNDTVIEAGMLLCIEPTLMTAPDRRYHVEDLVLIKPDGPEILSTYLDTTDMFVVPLATP